MNCPFKHVSVSQAVSCKRVRTSHNAEQGSHSIRGLFAHFEAKKCKQHYQIYGLIESKPSKASIFGTNLNKAIACEDNLIFAWQIPKLAPDCHCNCSSTRKETKCAKRSQAGAENVPNVSVLCSSVVWNSLSPQG